MICEECGHNGGYHDANIGCDVCKDCVKYHNFCTCAVFNQCDCKKLPSN